MEKYITPRELQRIADLEAELARLRKALWDVIQFPSSAQSIAENALAEEVQK